MPSAAAPRGRANWLMMGTGLVAMFSMAGWFWLARPHTVPTVPSLATVAAATPVAPPSPAVSSPTVSSPAMPEMTAPHPAPQAALVRLPKAVVPARARPLPSGLPSASRPEEPIAFGGILGEAVLSVKRGAAPAATTSPVPESVPVEIQKSRAKTPDPAVGLFRLGVLYQQAGDHHRAIEQYRALLALDPRHVSALNNLAVSLRHLGELEAAADLLKRATALDPTDDKAFTNLGVVRQLQERPDSAIEAHLRALAINSRNWESAFNLGLLFWEARDLERASERFLKVVSLHPHASAYYHLGLIAERQGRPNEALRRYRQVIQEREGAQADLRAQAERRVQDLVGLARR